MIKQKFGWTGVKVPVIGQGTWMIEGDSDTESRAVKALQLGLKLGMTHIDTAEMYGNGHTEELVAQAIDGQRNEVFLVSKVLPSHATYEGTIEACKQSLRRLNTEWLDMYLLHWPGSIPIRETMRAMEKLVKEGLVRFIGVSNFDVEELQAAENALRDQRMACNQVLYHLGYRGIERRLLPYCTAREIVVVGYAPFGHGNFLSPESAGGQILAEIAERHGRTPRQVALNFLTRHPNVFTIPKTTHPERTRENSGGTGWKLTEDDIQAIDRAFPVHEFDMPLQMI
jgi:diketogulonate reductase-like aldo/keto reductase